MLSGVKLFASGWYHVEDGKIRSLKVVFDPRPVLAARAAYLAYIDTFWILGAICLAAILLLFFAKKNKPGQASMAH